MFIVTQVDTYRECCKPGKWESITARSGLTNPLHNRRGDLDMSIQAEQH